MKKIIIIIGVIIGVVLLDSLQALLFNNKPIIGIDTHCRTRRGILVETYYCGNNKNITTIKKDNNCPRDEVCIKVIKEEIKENLNNILKINSTSSNPYDYIKNDYYKNIINLGNTAVPVIISMHDNNEIESLEAYILAIAIQEITNCDIRKEYAIEWSTEEEFYNLWKDHNCNLYDY